MADSPNPPIAAVAPSLLPRDKLKKLADKVAADRPPEDVPTAKHYAIGAPSAAQEPSK